MINEAYAKPWVKTITSDSAGAVGATGNWVCVDRLGYDYVIFDVCHLAATNTSAATKWVRCGVYHDDVITSSTFTNYPIMVGNSQRRNYGYFWQNRHLKQSKRNPFHLGKRRSQNRINQLS